MKRISTAFIILALSVTGLSSTASAANIPVAISGLLSAYGPSQSVSYKITGTPGDSCQLSYQNQAAKPFTFGASGSMTATFTTGLNASAIVIKISCTLSGSTTANSQLTLDPITLASVTLPGEDVSVNSTLSSIIEPLQGSCESGEVVVVRGDASSFNKGDSAKVEVANASGVVLLTSKSTSIATTGQSSLTVISKVCAGDSAYQGVDSKYKLTLTYTDAPGYFSQTQTFEFQLISRAEVKLLRSYAVNKAETECDFQSQLVQNNFSQSGLTRKAGEKMVITGTLFRSGFASPGDQISLEKVTSNSKAVTIARTVTDSTGKYTFTFPVETFPKVVFYRILAPTRTAAIGPVSGPFPAKSWNLFIECKSGCKIRESATSEQEEIVQYQKSCLDAIALFDVVTSQSDDENAKLLRKIILAPAVTAILKSRSETNAKNAQIAAEAAAAAAAAAAAKKSTLGSSSSGSTYDYGSGGQCYVSGYTTKKGKRVSGYWRSC